MPLDQLVRHATVQARLAKGSCARKFGRLRSVKSATVQTDVKQRDYIGARAHTNNTGELSAVHHALLNALSRPAGAGKEVIWSDSLYTINMTTGRWLPKCKRNKILIENLRQLWRRLQRSRPHEVSLRHVRSHIRVPGNELADWLADLGRGGGGVTLAEAERWMADWLRRGEEARTGRSPELGDPG